MVVAAGRTAREVRTHTGDGAIGVPAVELQLDVAVKLLEAVLAAELRPGGSQQRREQAATIGEFGRRPRLKARRRQPPPAPLIEPRVSRPAGAPCV